MANVKIQLHKDETIEDAKNKLFKALESQRNGDIHTEDFADKATREVVQKMITLHTTIYMNLMQEVLAELDKEYSSDNIKRYY